KFWMIDRHACNDRSVHLFVRPTTMRSTQRAAHPISDLHILTFTMRVRTAPPRRACGASLSACSFEPKISYCTRGCCCPAIPGNNASTTYKSLTEGICSRDDLLSMNVILLSVKNCAAANLQTTIRRRDFKYGGQLHAKKNQNAT